MPPKARGTGPKNLAKTGSAKSGRVKNPTGLAPRPPQPRSFNKNTARNATNPTKAS